MDAILEAENISKYFHDPVKVQVLKEVSLHVNYGEFVSIMGKSGCGKSTLLYILSTMDTDYTGNVRLNNRVLKEHSATELAHIRNEFIGFVFQFHYLLPEFTVLENVMLPAMKLGNKSKEAIEQAAYDKLKLLGVEAIAKHRATQISGGQKQRVAIARALINNPKIIMGDEPTGNLDSKNSGLVFDIFRELASSQGMSLLVVTHDPDFAKRTDRIITMEDGKII